MSDNGLEQKTTAELIALLSTLKDSGVSHLHLGNLGQKTGAELAAILNVLKNSGISHLDLGSNNLGQKTVAELIAIFSALKESGITHLDLSWNFLGEKTAIELVAIFSALKDSGITHLDLNFNVLFHKKTAEELALIVQAIPQTIATVSLTIEELKKMSPKHRQAIQTRFPKAEQIILVDEDHRQLNPSLSRADANLYARLGFKASTPSLFNSASFFVAINKDKFGSKIDSTLPHEAIEGVNRFRG
ncbi:hypothetical protein [Legionella cherrii]|uniref:Leucine-rich repeat-containing protein n=1 Tax=Legionella cherrii TaxID=28084 RepID=A0ABY6T9K3_9GAMM|nr:hypothetical protein [Legionella cherrii]VEB38691.1 leucine-rich repeat-containing protein [Legionella cherrii]